MHLEPFSLLLGDLGQASGVVVCSNVVLKYIIVQ